MMETRIARSGRRSVGPAGRMPPPRPDHRPSESTLTTTTPMNKPQPLQVSEAARKLGAHPRDISVLFYLRKLSDVRCPVVCGRRQVDPDYLGTIASELRRAGKACLPESELQLG